MNPNAPIEGHGTAERVATEPVIWRGCTQTEILTAAIVGGLASLIITPIYTAYFGDWQAAPGYFIAGVFIAAFSVIVALKRFKRGRPDGEIYQIVQSYLPIKTHMIRQGLTYTIGSSPRKHAYELESHD